MKLRRFDESNWLACYNNKRTLLSISKVERRHESLRV